MLDDKKEKLRERLDEEKMGDQEKRKTCFAEIHNQEAEEKWQEETNGVSSDDYERQEFNTRECRE